MRIRAVLLLAIFTTVALAQPDADARRRRRRSAKKRVVILPFSGPRAGAVRTRLVRSIRRRVRLISYSKYRRTAERLKVEERTPAGIATVCAKLKCHAVVAGQVDKQRRRRYLVTVSVYNAGDGEVLGESTYRARGRRRLLRAGRILGRKTVRLARQGSIPTAPPVEPPPPPPPVDETPVEEPIDEAPPLVS